MQERSLLDYWLIVYERRFVIYLIIVTSIVSALIIGKMVRPIYEARAALYIPAKVDSVSYMTSTAPTTLARRQNSPLAKEVDYKPYLGMLKSVQLAEIVHEQYPQKSVLKLLRSDTDFEVTDELIVRVYSRDPDPVLAANVANAYVKGLNKILSEGSQAQLDREPAYIRSALNRVDRDLKTAETELKRFEEKHHVTNLDTELVALSTQKTNLQDKADDTLVQIAAIRAKQKALVQQIKREGQDLEASEVATTSPLIENLRVQLADALTKLSELEGELGSNNLQLAAQRKRKDDLEQQLSEEIKRWFSSRIKPANSSLEKLRQQLIDVVIEGQRLEALSQASVRSLARLDKRLRAYPEIKARGVELSQKVDQLRKKQDQLRVNLTESQLQAERKMDLVVQLDRAEPPGKPAFPVWWLNALVALFAGTVAGLGYAFFLNYIKETRKVRTIRLVRAILGRN